MVDDGVYKIKDGVGYDVYFNGKLVGWARTAQEGNKLYNEWEEAEARKRQKQSKENETKMADNPQQSEGQNAGQGQQQQSQGDATGRGGSTILPPVIVLHMSKGWFWAWFFLLLAGLAILWYFTGWKIYIFWIIVGLGILWILIGISATASAISKGRDYATFFWITCALIIWALDMVPANFPVLGQLLGEPWAGFEWYGGIFDISWGSIITSSLVFALLYVNMVYNIVKHEVRSFILAFITILVLNNLIARFFPNSLGYNIPVPYASVGFIIFLAFIIGGFVLAIYLDKKLQSEIPNFFSYLFMIFVFSFFWVNTGWTNNWRAVLHAIFIIGFGFEYIRPKERQNPAIWHIAIPSLLILDFFGYGALFSSDYLWVKFIPVLVLSVIIYCYAKTENWYAILSLVIIVTIILILSLQITAYEGGTFQFRQRTGGADFKQFFGTLGEKLTGVIQQRLEFATGGYYTGSVEKNRYESLGVYFSNIRAADPRFYTDEPITVWGTIRSKTYKDAVIINFSCYRLKDNKRIRADKIIPNIKFPIFSLEEVDTECTFLPKAKDDQLAIQPSSNTITFSAEYNFGTDAYLKTYFIDRDRFRAYAREGFAREEDILKELGIKDTKPGAVFTNGPIEIGIGSGPLVTVSEGYTIKPSIGITLTNRKEIQDKDKRIITRWEGKIKNITELVLLVPPGIGITDLDKCKSLIPEERAKCPCNMPFYEYKTQHCFDSCNENVYSPCEKACADAYNLKISDEREGFGSKTHPCVQECETALNRCNEECNFLFQVGEGEGPTNQKYTGYALDVGSLEFRDLNKDIDKHRSFSCRFDPSQSVLDKTPITTRYFRVRARYNYLIENSVTVNIESLPTRVENVVPEPFTKIAEFLQKPDIYFPGLTTELVSAIASVESKFRHCCKDASHKGSDCVESGEKDCPFERLITSGSSFGIMQIQYNTAKSKAYVDSFAKKYCGENVKITNYDCNVKVGITILSDKYRLFRNGCNKYPELTNACNNCQSSMPPYKKYKDYTGVEAAIRGYNGWGCGTNADTGYVERVLNAMKTVKGINIIDPTTLKSITREGEGMFSDETITQKPSSVSNILADDTPNTRNSITITWSPSSTPNVQYKLVRYNAQTGEDSRSYFTSNTKFIDTEVQDDIEYYYKISAISDYDESDVVQSNNVRSVDDTITFTQGGP